LQVVKFEEVFRVIQNASLGYIIIAFLFVVFNQGAQILKWHYLLKVTNTGLSFADALKSYLFGVTLGTITPGQLGELGGRALHIENNNRAFLVGLTIFDRAQMFVIMAFCGIPAVVYLLSFNLLYTFAAFFIEFICLLLVYFNTESLKIKLNGIKWKLLKKKFVQDLLGSFTFLNRTQFLISSMFSILVFFIVYFQTTILLLAFVDVNFSDALWGYSAVMFTKALLPISFGDLGVREAASILFYGKINVPIAAAFNTALLMFFINIFLPSLVGVLFIPSFNKRNILK
jgi:uncharacterized protein (TIRG00374 family)